MRDPLTKYPTSAYRAGFVLEDREGRRISFHRTVSGALPRRRTLLEQELECSPQGRTAA
jgi:hypothetical protein